MLVQEQITRPGKQTYDFIRTVVDLQLVFSPCCDDMIDFNDFHYSTS